jgi:hypothetical protein
MAPVPCRTVERRFGDIIRWYGTNTDIEDRKRAEALLAAEKRTLEMIAGGAQLADILKDLCDTVDAHAGNIISAVMLMDPDGMRLWPAAAPRLPKGWIEAISPLEIGPAIGFCGISEAARDRFRHCDRPPYGSLIETLL